MHEATTPQGGHPFRITSRACRDGRSSRSQQHHQPFRASEDAVTPLAAPTAICPPVGPDCDSKSRRAMKRGNCPNLAQIARQRPCSPASGAPFWPHLPTDCFRFCPAGPKNFRKTPRLRSVIHDCAAWTRAAPPERGRDCCNTGNGASAARFPFHHQSWGSDGTITAGALFTRSDQNRQNTSFVRNRGLSGANHFFLTLVAPTRSRLAPGRSRPAPGPMRASATGPIRATATGATVGT